MGTTPIVASDRSSGNYRGGSGADHFVVSAESVASAVDIAILDFEDGTDRIDLSGFGFDPDTLLNDLSIVQDGDDTVIQLSK